MEKTATNMVYLASPAALRAFGSVNPKGHITEVPSKVHKIRLLAKRAVSSGTPYAEIIGLINRNMKIFIKVIEAMERPVKPTA
jgi:hypothetical protein